MSRWASERPKLPAEDAEVSGLARNAFEKQGIRIETEATVQCLAWREDGVAASPDRHFKRVFEVR